MNRQIMSLLVAAVVLAGEVRASALDVVATTPDLAAIAREVGGEYANVGSIARGVQDPHYVEAKPSYMRQVNRADLLIYNGLELEVGWLPLLLQGARNSRLVIGSVGLLDTSAGVPLLEVPEGEIDRSMGDVHPFGNPHYLLDPRNGIRAAETIAGRLAELDPSHGDTYRENARAFAHALSARIASWEDRLADLRGARVIAYHKTWEYLADWLGLEILQYVEEKPGIPPGPRHLARVVELIKAEGISTILVAHYNPRGQADGVARKSGAQVVVLPAAVEAEKSIPDYVDLFETISVRLVAVGNGQAQ